MIKKLKNADRLSMDKIIAAPIGKKDMVMAYAKRAVKKHKGMVNPAIPMTNGPIGFPIEADVKKFVTNELVAKFPEMPELNGFMPEVHQAIDSGDFEESVESTQIASILDTCGYIFDPVENAFTVAHTLIEFDAPNRNKDCIPLAEAESFVRQMPGQAVTWEHEPDIFIGSVVAAAVDPLSHLLCCASRLWIARFNLDQYTEPAIEAYKNGTLAFSFEIYYKEAECSVCHKIFPATIKDRDGDPTYNHYCDHLKGRFAPGNPCYRIMHDVIPYGESVVDVPAYRDSTAFLAASVNETDKLLAMISELQEKLEKILVK